MRVHPNYSSKKVFETYDKYNSEAQMPNPPANESFNHYKSYLIIDLNLMTEKEPNPEEVSDMESEEDMETMVRTKGGDYTYQLLRAA